MRPGVKCALTFALAWLLGSSASFAQIGSVLQEAGKSVVKIEVGDKAASGFVWIDSAHVVTALHVVDGANSVIVHYVNSDGAISDSSPAVVERVLKESDLVLLRVTRPQNRNPLTLNLTPPTVAQSMQALGFPLNIAGYSGTEVKIRFGGSQLSTILPAPVIAKITDYPSTEIQILNLEGNLVPGLSGGPIIDAAGKVIGIADGGLENGAIGICWGIRATDLTRLAQSTVASLPHGVGVTELFAADLQANVSPTLTVGAIQLTKVRTRSFAQLAQTTDDAMGLRQLVMPYISFNPQAFLYDIYQESGSGATIVVPANAQLSNLGTLTVVNAGDSRMQMKFELRPVRNDQETAYQATIFEQALVEPNQYTQVNVDPAWSYASPIDRSGILTNRKALVRNVYNGYQLQTDKYYLETLALNRNRGTLLAVAAVNNDYSPRAQQMEMSCFNGYRDPICGQLWQSRRLWVQMILGVHLSGFPQVQM